MSHTEDQPEFSFAQIPDFRNLGVMLRVMVGTNAVLALGTLVAANSFSSWLLHMEEASLLVQPGLLLWLLCMWLMHSWLRHQRVWLARFVICSLSLVCVAALRLFVARMVGPLDSFGWLRLLALTLALVMVGQGYFSARLKALMPAVTEARLQALQARIRPHFLFNSLNAVLSLIRTEPAKAERALEDMADLFRVFMRENKELSTLKRELDLAWQYLELERLRLGERLQVDWNIDKMPENALIPPLVIQPLLENAVYHGIEPTHAPGVVRIDIFRSRDEVHVVVRNPFRPDATEKHQKGNRMAMANIRERLALHFDAEAGIAATSGADYFQVHIHLPYKEIP